MSDFALTLKLGIGDVLYTWAALEKHKHNFNNIYIDANWSILAAYKYNSQEYKNYFVSFVKTLFTDPKYILFSGMNGASYEFTDLSNVGIYPALPRAAHLLCKESPHKIDGQYIIVTTKVRQYDRNNFNEFSSKLITELNKLSSKYKIVLTGERELESNPEYDIYGSRYIYSIYNDLIKVSNVIDLTVPVLGATNPSLDKMKEDCYLMNKARCVITIGCGGNLSLAAATANNLIGIRKDDYKFADTIFRAAPENIKVISDKSDFINRISNL